MSKCGIYYFTYYFVCDNLGYTILLHDYVVKSGIVASTISNNSNHNNPCHWSCDFYFYDEFYHYNWKIKLNIGILLIYEI
jgi:hypothetical protein